MKLGCTIMKDMFLKYQGSGITMLLFAAAFLYLFIANREFRQRLGVPLLFMMVVLFNPVFYWYIWIKLMGATVWRVFWVFGGAIVFAYALLDISKKVKGKYAKIIPIALGVLMYVCGGRFLYAEKVFTVAENNYKIPQEAIETAEFLLQQEENPHVVLHKKLYNYVRQYTNDIDILYGRDIQGYTYKSDDVGRLMVHHELKKRNPDCAIVAQICHERNIDYLVLKKKQNVNFEEYGYRQIGEVDKYIIYQSTW